MKQSTDELVLVVSLEVHAELATKTKTFCDSPNNPNEEKPNVNVCPICLGHPGTLPVINKEAVRQVIRVGLAVGGTIAEEYSEFDRKNYFYPDVPKNFQTSQYDYPLVTGGEVAGVALTRIHLEEDTAKSTHHDGEEGGHSLVDFNRAGVPLMELVTEPVITSAEQAATFAKEFQLLLRLLGASEANMEKGEMRVEANISVGKKGEFGTKVEVKNLNSFRSVFGAIQFEEARHRKLIAEGRADEIVQETRGWDEHKQQTFSQRNKESSHDYRYFPEPDLPKMVLKLSEDLKPSALVKSLPELPDQKRRRYIETCAISEEAAEVLVRDQDLGGIFDEAYEKLNDKSNAKLLSNYITSDLVALREASGAGKVTVDHLVELIEMITSDKLSSRGAKDTLAYLHEHGGESAEQIAKDNGLIQESDEGAIEALATEIIEENPEIAEEIRAGKDAGIQFMIGQGMKKTKGSVNPGLLAKALAKALKQ